MRPQTGKAGGREIFRMETSNRFESLDDQSDEETDEDDLGGEVGLREEDLGEGMTREDMGGGGVGMLGGGGEALAGWFGPLPAACCIRQWILNQLERRP